MCYLDVEVIENIVIGVVFLGIGGGGDFYIGKMMVLFVIEENGFVKLVFLEEIVVEDFFLFVVMMGVLFVVIEKFFKGDEFVCVFEKLGKYLD